MCAPSSRADTRVRPYMSRIKQKSHSLDREVAAEAKEKDAAAGQKALVDAVGDKAASLGHCPGHQGVPGEVGQDVTDEEEGHPQPTVLHGKHDVAQADGEPPDEPVGVGGAHEHPGHDGVEARCTLGVDSKGARGGRP